MSNAFIGQKIISKSVGQTQKLANQIAKKILANTPGQGAFVLALRGDLGSGKTTFTQGLSKGLGVKNKVNSPTFVILKRFKIQGAKFKNFYHIDCYRLNESEEILELGWLEIVTNPQNIIAIEWPEKIKKFLPKEAIYLNLKFIDKNQREIKVGKTAIFMLR